VIAHGIPIYLALEPVDMRFGAERLGALVREKMRAEPRTRALFAFVGKRGHTMKVLTWDGTGTIVIHKKLDAGRFELPRATTPSEQHLVISDAMFDAIHKGVALTPRTPRQPRHH
jgi:transposase